MTTYGRCPAATWRRLGRGVILAVPGATHTLQLNSTGAVLWDLLREPSELSTVTSRLAAHFARPERDVCPAVRDLLEELRAWGAVVIQE